MTQLEALEWFPEGLRQHDEKLTQKIRQEVIQKITQEVTQKVTQEYDRKALRTTAAGVRNVAQSLGKSYEQVLDLMGSTIVPREDILEYLRREDAGEIT